MILVSYNKYQLDIIPFLFLVDFCLPGQCSFPLVKSIIMCNNLIRMWLSLYKSSRASSPIFYTSDLALTVGWFLYCLINSLAPGGFENIFQNVFFKLISWIDTLSNSCQTALRSMPQNPSDDKSTLVQVMAWCRQAASHYLSQCCPRSLSPYGVTRPQWVKKIFYNVAVFFFTKHICDVLIYETMSLISLYIRLSLNCGMIPLLLD